MTAAQRLGRAPAVVEMLVGQLYLVTVIGVLVGSLAQRRPGAPGDRARRVGDLGPDPPGRDPDMTADSEVSPLGRNWWLFLIVGLISIVAGVLAIVYPGITLLGLAFFAGVGLLFAGGLEIVVLFGISLLGRGVGEVYTAFKLRGVLHTAEPDAVVTT